MPITRLQTQSLYELMSYIHSLYNCDSLDYDYFQSNKNDSMKFIRENSKKDAQEIARLITIVQADNTKLFESSHVLTCLYNRIITVFYTMSDVAKIAEKIYGENCSVVTVDWDTYARDYEKSFIYFQNYQKKINYKQQVKKQKIN
jgi:hypothetical protein